MNWPFLTDPGLKLSGQFKSKPEDFIVEEIPLYLPTGIGEHLYLFIEKTGITTDQFIQRVMKKLQISIKRIGYAGKKDKIGITRQWISISNVEKAEVEKLQNPGIKILKMEFHKNKLRLGHLHGNRFQIIIRNVPGNSEEIANTILTRLATIGIPNYFGLQRFGMRGDNALVGSAILQNNWNEAFSLILAINSSSDEGPSFSDDRLHKMMTSNISNNSRSAAQVLMESKGRFEEAGKRLPKHITRFYLNALQSYWFNASLVRRLPDIHKIWRGDLAYLHKNGAVFKVENESVEQSRVDKFEISPSGPLWGHKMIQPSEREIVLEKEVLQESGVEPEQLNSSMQILRLQGQRRSYRVPLMNYSFKQEKTDLFLEFDLPSGSYATSVVRELMKDNFPEIEVLKPKFESKTMEIT